MHKGLKDLFDYPLMSAINERRTRRVSRGTSVPAGPLSHVSQNQPARLSPLEEAVLIVSTGLTGVMMHDGPLDLPNGGKELGTPMLRILARSGSSPDNVQGTVLFMINDDGVWLLKRPSPPETLRFMKDLPRNRAEWSEADWIAMADAVKVHLYPERLEFPREFPYYHVWNKQLSNRPGTTIFLPLVDTTRGIVNIILNLLSEPDGERGLILDDWQPFRPKNLTEVGAWLAAGLGIIPEKIPYQPVGGIEWARSGFLNPKIRLPLGLAHAWRLDYEALFLLQNLMLIGQGMGLGAWVHASIFPPYIFERDAAQGHLGLGFRMHTPTKEWHHEWPPLPAPLPNPVGIDGVLQGLCPPYVTSMNDAVDQVLEEKYGSNGGYSDPAVFGKAFRNQADAATFLQNAERYPKKGVEYVKVVCNYILDTYGRFPAHVDAFHLPGVWLQMSHLELEYYEKMYDPELYRRQAGHDAIWGDH
jgi:hypothetical protein